MTDSAARTIALTHNLRNWLQGARLDEEPASTDLAVGLADFVAAAARAQDRVEALLKLDPAVPGQADEALTLAAELEAYLFTEIKSQLERLEAAWPRLLERLDKLSPEITN